MPEPVQYMRMNYYDLMISSVHATGDVRPAAGRVELRAEGQTLPFAKALVPRKPPAPLNGTLLLQRDKRTDNLLNAWHLSGAKKNCTLYMYSASGSLVGRYFLMGAKVTRIETERKSGSLTGPSHGLPPSADHDLLVESVGFTYEKIEI